ncbi:unnamed protein product, partial [Symbiodinium necroappetens]
WPAAPSAWLRTHGASHISFGWICPRDGLCCGLCRYLANTKPYLFFLGHLAVAAGVLFA